MRKFLERHALAYQLLPVEYFVQKILPAFINSNSEPHDSELAKLKTELDHRVGDVKAGINHAMLGFKKDYDSRAYIQYNQEALVGLGGQLLFYTHPVHLGTARVPLPGVVSLSKLVFQAIEELLLFMETFFPEYFDLDSWVPIPYLRIVQHEISASIGDVQSRLLELGIDPKLLAIVMLSFKRFLADPAQDGSYRKTTYLRRLCTELYYLSRQCTPASIDASMRTLLHTIDFNLEEFVEYCTDHQEQLLANTEGSYEDQIRILTRFRKYLSRIKRRSWFTFDIDRPTLFNELSKWIEDDKDYIESTQEISKSEHAEATDGQWSLFKITVDLTTDQLFYLVRVLLAIALIQCKNKKRLTQFVANFFRTNRTTEIAGRNVRKKIYAVNDEVKKAVRAWLQRAIDFIDQDDGEIDPW